MSRQAIRVRSCDRCPVGKEKPSTRTIRFSMNESGWEIDVCEKHGSDLENEIYAWGRLAREIAELSTPRAFSSENLEEHRHAAELRGRQSADDRSRLRSAIQRPVPHPVKLTGAPENADAYTFTEHARERLAERNVSPIDALWCASSPTVIRPARMTGLVVHERGETKVVLNPQTRTIITVASLTGENSRKAI